MTRRLFPTMPQWTWGFGGAVVGYILEEATDGWEELATATSWAATAFIMFFGVRVLSDSFKTGMHTLSAAVIAMWVANLAFSFGFQPEAVVDILFDVATILTMFALLHYANELRREE